MGEKADLDLGSIRAHGESRTESLLANTGIGQDRRVRREAKSQQEQTAAFEEKRTWLTGEWVLNLKWKR